MRRTTQRNKYQVTKGLQANNKHVTKLFIFTIFFFFNNVFLIPHSSSPTSKIFTFTFTAFSFNLFIHLFIHLFIYSYFIFYFFILLQNSEVRIELSSILTTSEDMVKTKRGHVLSSFHSFQIRKREFDLGTRNQVYSINSWCGGSTQFLCQNGVIKTVFVYDFYTSFCISSFPIFSIFYRLPFFIFIV